MTTTTPPPATGVVPYVQVSDASAAAELYKRAFGATSVVPVELKMFWGEPFGVRWSIGSTPR